VTVIPAPSFAHLLRMTDRQGTFEHASSAVPRPERGYRTDDMARVLVVTTREPDSTREVNGLAGVAVRFLNEAQSYSGSCRNRRERTGRWNDEPSVEDHWGRCVWALGTAAAHSDVSLVRKLAVVQFDRAAATRSPHPRAMAFAALGAAELLSVEPTHKPARQLLTDYAASIAEPTGDDSWPWPEPRLAHTNAVLAEAIIAAGVGLDRPELVQQGLGLLAWLVATETTAGHLSPTPADGRGPDDARPGFDQRPIEVSTLADACARAATVDDNPLWPDTVLAAAAWFQGANDAGEPMWDPETGGGFDALRSDGVSRDQGAEATLALISTLQHARSLSPVSS
jgi:hypothetical protein